MAAPALFQSRVPLALSLLAALGEAQTMKASIEEWRVPWSGTRPRDPSVAPDGRVWFVGQQGDYAAHFDTATKEMKRFDLPSGAGPHTVLVDGLGRPWYTGNTASHIGRLDPATSKATRFSTPGVGDPHTLTFAPDGGLWFSAQNANVIGRLDTATGKVDTLRVPTSGARPYGIATAPDGTVWCVLFGTNKLARIDPVKKTLREVPLPRTGTRPRRIGITSDGAVWYVDYSGGRLGRYNPGDGGVQDWPCPAATGSAPYSMTVDDKDRIWLVETGPNPNRLVGFDPATRAFTAPMPIPSGGGTVRHMVFHRPTRSIWFATDANTLVRATLTDAPPTSLPPRQAGKTHLPRGAAVPSHAGRSGNGVAYGIRFVPGAALLDASGRVLPGPQP
jgi:virginiamycin B lyase